MTDHLVIRGLHVPARIGVTAEERAQEQTLVVNLDVTTDLAPAGASDDLEDTIDYAALISSIDVLVRSSEVELLETLAQKIADEIAHIKEATGVTVEIAKEIVPVTEKVEEVTIKIVRQFS
ncbi:MAG TPA: dihydroneopterin aldolase [Actinomycetota bacterium]